jgi:hypothetical protein
MPMLDVVFSRPPQRLACIATVLLAALPAAATDLAGDLSGHLAAGVYRIVDDIRVPAGRTLDLAPGVVFEFEDGWWEEYEFDVEGALVAAGTAAQPVVFRAAAGVPEFNYLRLAGDGSVLRHTIVERVGSVSLSDAGGLWIDGCRPLLEDVEVREATWHGIYVTGAGARPTVRRAHVHGCAADGIDGDDGAGLHLENCRILGNGGDGVCLGGGENLLVGCLIAGNGEDGVDSHGLDDFAATLVNCTVGPHPSEAFSDAGAYDLINCVAVADDFVGTSRHSLLVGDLAFLDLVDPAGGDWRPRDASPCRDRGLRFGTPQAVLPAIDLGGLPRIVGIIDAGAYEAQVVGPTGEEGALMSAALISPRLTQPTILTPGEPLAIRMGRLGAFAAADAAVRLRGPAGEVVPLPVVSIAARDLLPDGDLAVELYAPGLETVQEIVAAVPAGTASALYALEVDLSGRTYASVNAVQVLASYPAAWTCLHITDPHVGYDAESYTAAERLGFFVTEANALNPALVVVTGDICENQNLEHGAWAEEFLSIIAGLRVPCLVLPGNHDHYNEGGDWNPHGYFRYFERINRTLAGEFKLGPARFYTWNTRHELGTLELYRCAGPSSPSLDWTQARLEALPPGAGPRFALLHGPTYDYFSWNAENTGRVRDLLQAHGFALALAGHTHRFETFRNQGENWLGRNDYEHEDDWGRDVAFPGFPLHVQTSSLGKEEHLALPVAAGVPPPPARETAEKGLFGDDIGWRAVRVENGQVAWFSADTDGDGFRSTEDAWLLGGVAVTVASLPDGAAVSTIVNGHHETWSDIRHYVPADPALDYAVAGGSLVRRWADGTLEIAAAALPAGGSSVVTVTPLTTSAPSPHFTATRLLGAAPNPFNPATVVRFELAIGGPVSLAVHDLQGRLVRRLAQGVFAAGRHEARWDGAAEDGRAVAAGVYVLRLSAVGAVDEGMVTLLK